MRNDIRIAWRSLKKNKLFTLINVLGLSVGLCACLCVATVVIDDLSYDTHWEKKEDIYRVLSKTPMGEGNYEKMASSFAGMEFALTENFPEVETVVNLYSGDTNFKIDKDQENTIPTTILSTSNKIWEVFDFEILLGDPKKFIDGTRNLVITQSYKETYFGNADPVGKIIQDVPTYGETPSEFLITGVIEDIPSNTHIRAQAIVITKPRVEALAKEQYGTFRQYYMTVKPSTDIASLTDKVNTWYADFVTAENPYQYEFQPIADVYLHSEFEPWQEVKGSLNTIYILSGIAFLLLIIACINFVNLSASRSLQRIKEIGVRKVMGAGNLAITRQFLVESLLYFVISTVLATGAYYLVLSKLESFKGHPLEMTFLSNLSLLASAYGFVLLVSVAVGLYPAILMSRLKTSSSLKGSVKSSSTKLQPALQKGLITFQFVLSMVVLIGLIVVNDQVNFMKEKDLGYNTQNLLSISNISWDGKGGVFKQKLLQLPGVQNATITSFLPGSGSNYMGTKIDDPYNPEQSIDIGYIRGDVDLAKTLELKLSKGRLLNKDFATDVLPPGYRLNLSDTATNQKSALISEFTAKALKINQLNKAIPELGTNPVGILEDFHSKSLHNPLTPTIIIAESRPDYGGMLIRIDPKSAQTTLLELQKLWKEIYPVKLLDLNWIDEKIEQQYIAETRLQQFFSFFSSLSMLLAALGVFGLIAQATTLRIKEIGIRKVLGASVSSIVVLFSKDFAKLIIIAGLIAAPVSWYLLSDWLQDFAYHIDISFWVFIVAAVVTLMIALATIGIQTVKAAIANPVDSLRSE